MLTSNRRLLIALCAWETGVIGFFLASIALTRDHFWGKKDLVWIAVLAICGLFVVGSVVLLSRRFGKIGGAITGALCGVLQSVFILAWVLVARPGFEASAGWAGCCQYVSYSERSGRCSGPAHLLRTEESITDFLETNVIKVITRAYSIHPAPPPYRPPRVSDS